MSVNQLQIESIYNKMKIRNIEMTELKTQEQILEEQTAEKKQQLRKIRCKIYDLKYRTTQKAKRTRQEYMKKWYSNKENRDKKREWNKQWSRKTRGFRLFWNNVKREYGFN